MPLIQALDRQRSIFVGGLAGQRPVIPFHADALRESARRNMSAKAWAYVDGGAGNEESIRANAGAFASYAIRPHMMRPNEQADFSTGLLGMKLAFPLLLA